MTKANSECSMQYFVRNYETDFMQCLRPSAMLGYFQEVAAKHSEEMGMGFGTLRQDGRFWVLSKICVQISRRPQYEERVNVRTRPHIPSRAMYERSFFMEDAAGNIVIRALSRWCVLDGSGKIVPTAQVPYAEIDLIQERAFDDCDWRIGEAERVQEQPAYSIVIANSEYDMNRHVSNIKYADYIFNCFTVKELSARPILGFSLHYVRQAYEGDELAFYRQAIGEGTYLVTGRRGEETVVTARVEFGRE